jgi:hypothetical protein
VVQIQLLRSVLIAILLLGGWKPALRGLGQPRANKYRPGSQTVHATSGRRLVVCPQV